MKIDIDKGRGPLKVEMEKLNVQMKVRILVCLE